MTEKKEIGRVLVVGAGISGIKAALELAETGYQVLLVDSSPHIGGILAKLDHQFPTDHCGICRMLPMVGREYASQFCMRKGLYHENIEILPFTEVAAISGDVGKFSVELRKKPAYVDPAKCNGMGECIKVCPMELHDDFNHALTKRKAIYQMVPHNLPNMLRVDRDACSGCTEQPCLQVCPNGAIDFAQQEQSETRQVNTIILAAGSKLWDTSIEDAKSYAVSPDVVTALAFERILSPSGTYDGVIRRPSDGKPAKRIAWIQCMGSRNRRLGRDYCSSICCMFALKEAVLAKEKGGSDTETTIFYMDMRTFGKDLFRYFEKAVDMGVRLVRCRVQQVHADTDGSLKIRYFDQESNEFKVETFDLTVLSTGQAPFAEHKNFSEILNLNLNQQQLLPTDELSKVRLGKPGVFICGSFMGLTDISEAVSSGIAAAGEASKVLAALDVTTVNEAKEPEQVDTSAGTEAARIELILCKGFTDKEGYTLNADLLTQALATGGVVDKVRLIDTIYTEEGLAEFTEILSKSKCNRLLIGVDKPLTYQNKLRKIAEQAGFHPSLVKLFDISSALGQDNTGDSLTLRLIRETRSHIDRLRFTPALHVDILPSKETALVIGGGIVGMYSALSLAERGAAVHLVERADKLGGYAGNEVTATVEGLNPTVIAEELARKIADNAKITVHLHSDVLSSSGAPGRYDTQIKEHDSGLILSIEHGAAILATGNQKSSTTAYHYADSDRILTQSEFGKALRAGDISLDKAEEIVMIQCVDSREKEAREYCSRVCCMGALQNALQIKEKKPDARVFVLYRDMMSYGAYERYYTEARSKGVIFVAYDLEHKPEVEVKHGKPVVSFRDPVLDANIELAADWLVLSTGIQADPGNAKLAETLGVSLNQDGFFSEADPKWRPIEFQKLGFYAVGVANAPMTLREAIMQAEAAAQKSSVFLSGREIPFAREVATIHDALCIRCKQCIDICPYGARSFDAESDTVVIDPATCQACGLCAVTCRNSAAEVRGWNDKQMLAMIDAQLMDFLTPTSA
ncbi:MAG: FAD-dependent oxidoreductase [Candidatus Electrothrix scaldis]|nr:MAG: FAD-dependent oxidoreductase [Candidatus Electrothrix sp. GW3-3]